jgi:GNAT superfamily N-acetyltransferase
MTLTVLPLTPARMPDLDAVFQARSCSVAKPCYCMYYRRSGADVMAGGNAAAMKRNRAAIAALARRAEADGGPPPGLIGYDQSGTPVGWVSLGPREDFARLARSRPMKQVDEQPVWSIICFVVPSAYRRQGVAHALLAGAVDWARERGVRLLEAYPVDRRADAAPDASWFGSCSMFEKAGFAEVARHTPARPIVRLALAPADPSPASKGKKGASC